MSGFFVDPDQLASEAILTISGQYVKPDWMETRTLDSLNEELPIKMAR